MTLGAVPGTEPPPRRGRQLIPAGLPRRGEVLALFAVTLVVGHLVFAPVALVVALVLAAAGQAIRWRPWWLLWPAAAGLGWVLATGPGAALADFTRWPMGILGSLGAGHRAAHAGHPFAAFRLAWSSLPGQLPVALVCGAAEAAVLGWLVWLHTDEWEVPAPRPGALAAVRGRLTAATIRAGTVLTRDGCALGVVPATGGVAELRWADMSCGLLITGDDPQNVALASLQVVHAALRRRKPLIVIDPSDAADPSGTAGLGRALTAACLATGTPLRTGGSAAGLAMVAGGGAQAAGAMRGASASRLWGRAREDPPGSPRAARAAVDLYQVIIERSAARLSADSPEAAARACADLAAIAQHLRAIGVDGDGLVWISRGELVPAADLAALLREAPAAGLPVLIGATSPTAAAGLAGLAGATLTLRVTDPGLASRLAELTGTRMLPAPAAAALVGGAAAAAAAGMWRPPGMPVTPPVSPPPAATVPSVAGLPTAVPAPPATPAQPGVQAIPGTDLVRCPVIPARTLHALGAGEFVLAVHVPRRRLIALGRLIPARLPHPDSPHRESPYGAPPRETPPRRTGPEVAGW